MILLPDNPSSVTADSKWCFSFCLEELQNSTRWQDARATQRKLQRNRPVTWDREAGTSCCTPRCSHLQQAGVSATVHEGAGAEHGAEWGKGEVQTSRRFWSQKRCSQMQLVDKFSCWCRFAWSIQRWAGLIVHLEFAEYGIHSLLTQWSILQVTEDFLGLGCPARPLEVGSKMSCHSC